MNINHLFSLYTYNLYELQLSYTWHLSCKGINRPQILSWLLKTVVSVFHEDIRNTGPCPEPPFPAPPFGRRRVVLLSVVMAPLPPMGVVGGVGGRRRGGNLGKPFGDHGLEAYVRQGGWWSSQRRGRGRWGFVATWKKNLTFKESLTKN